MSIPEFGAAWTGENEPVALCDHLENIKHSKVLSGIPISVPTLMLWRAVSLPINRPQSSWHSSCCFLISENLSTEYQVVR